MAETTDVATRMDRDASTRSADEIRHDIAATRESISDTVDKLGTKLQQKLDWREYVADHPMAAFGIAAGIGFLASAVFRRRPSPRERMLDALADAVDDIACRFRDGVESIASVATGRRNRGLSQTIKMAAGGAAAKAASSFAKQGLGHLMESSRPSPGVDEPQRMRRSTGTSL